MTMRASLCLLIAALFVSTGCTRESAADEAEPTANEPEAAEEAEAEAAGDEAAEGEDEGESEEGEAAEPPAAVADGEIAPVGSENAADILASVAGDGEELWVVFATTMGEINCRLEQELVPETVANFVGLATGNKTYIDPETNEPARSNFYDGLIFHRVIPDFMIQGGDPLGSGRGGPGFRFADEFHPRLRHDRPGVLSMANSGPNTNGSQFFITEAPTPHLDDRHSVFGYCEEIDTIARIARVPTGPGNRPLQDVAMESVVIERR